MGDMKLNLIRILYELRHKQSVLAQRERGGEEEKLLCRRKFIFRDFLFYSRRRQKNTKSLFSDVGDGTERKQPSWESRMVRVISSQR